MPSLTPSRIVLRHSNVSGEKPDNDDLLLGEVYINIPDNKLYYKNRDDLINPIVEINLTTSNDLIHVRDVNLSNDGDLIATFSNNNTKPLGNVIGPAGRGLAIDGVVDYVNQLPTSSTLPPIANILNKNGTLFIVRLGASIGSPFSPTGPRIYSYSTSGGGTWSELTGATVAASGANGTNGNTIRNGTASSPNNSDGNNGDYYLDNINYVLFGPKSAGVWPSTGVSLKGPNSLTVSTASDGTAVLDIDSVETNDIIIADAVTFNSTNYTFGTGAVSALKTALVISSADISFDSAIELNADAYASSTTGTQGANNGITWTAAVAGAAGNTLTRAIVIDSTTNRTALTTVKTVNDIVVTSGDMYTVLSTPRDSNREWQEIASSDDGTKLVATVNNGRIYTSTNSGVSWTARDSVRAWSGVASSSDGTKLVATVRGGQIYTSTDSGVNWTARDSNREWTGVASSSDGTKLVAVASLSRIYTSTDSGVSWTPRDSGRAWNAVASSSDGTKLVAVAAADLIYTSTDSGVNWTARDSARAWQVVASSSDGTKLVAAASDERIYTSTDSGVSWTARDSARAWTGVASSSDGTKLVAVSAFSIGRIYTSTDSGVSWTARDSARSWNAVASSSDGTKLVASASNGQIYTIIYTAATAAQVIAAVNAASLGVTLTNTGTSNGSAAVSTAAQTNLTGGIVTTTLSGTQTANRSIAFPDASGTLALTTHSHGNITNDGAIGTTADRVVTTGAGGVLTATLDRSGIDSRNLIEYRLNTAPNQVDGSDAGKVLLLQYGDSIWFLNNNSTSTLLAGSGDQAPSTTQYTLTENNILADAQSEFAGMNSVTVPAGTYLAIIRASNFTTSSFGSNYIYLVDNNNASQFSEVPADNDNTLLSLAPDAADGNSSAVFSLADPISEPYEQNGVIEVTISAETIFTLYGTLPAAGDEVDITITFEQ